MKRQRFLARRPRQTIALALVAGALASTAKADGESRNSEQMSAFAAVGYAVGEKVHLDQLGWSDAEFAAFVSGLEQQFRGGAAVPVSKAAQATFQAINQAIEKAQTSGGSRVDPRMLGDLVHRLQLQPIEDGLHIRLLRSGSGARPTDSDLVVVSLTARSIATGREIPSLSLKNVKARVDGLMPGLASGVKYVALGGEALLLVPPNLSFGNQSWPEGVPPGSPLLFLIEVHDIYAD